MSGANNAPSTSKALIASLYPFSCIAPCDHSFELGVKGGAAFAEWGNLQYRGRAPGQESCVSLPERSGLSVVCRIRGKARGDGLDRPAARDQNHLREAAGSRPPAASRINWPGAAVP